MGGNTHRIISRFSIFIGTVIVVLYYLYRIWLPEVNILTFILLGLLVILLGLVFNGKAGLLREASSNDESGSKEKSMVTGLLIAVRGLLATGFSYAMLLSFN